MRVARFQVVPMVVILIGLLAGCSGGGGGSSVSTNGRLELLLTDAPIDLSNVRSVTVTIEQVLVYPGTLELDGLVTSPNPFVTSPKTFDLLTLTQGTTTLLGSSELPAGEYQKIRIIVGSASLTFKNGLRVPLQVDPGKVDVPIHFEVKAAGLARVTLDFNAAASVQVNNNSPGGYTLRPVITPVRN